MSAARSVLVSACALLLLTGCTDAAKPTTAGTPAPTGTQGAASPATTASASVLALRRAVISYGQAVAGTTPATVREGLKRTAPNSVAYRYLEHMANTTDPLLQAAPPDPNRAPLPVGDDGFKFCTIPDNDFSCTTYGNFTVNQDGKLVDFTIDKEPVGPRLTVVSGQPITVGGARITLLTAYETMTGGHLVVSLKVASGAEPITTNPKTWAYRGPDGRPVPVWGASGPTYVVARSSVIVWMSFQTAKSGGSITVNGCPSQDCPGGSFSGVVKVG